MRKILLLAIILSSSSMGFSQFKLGFKFSPTLSTNRIDDTSDATSFSTDGAGLKFTAGPIADFALAENYFVSTGIFLATKRAAFSIREGSFTATEEYALQYIQIPLSIKLFTNEVALDKRIYFQVGATTEVNINEKPKKDSYSFIEDFKLIDTSLLLAIGMEYKVGLNTILFGGFSYSRGLLNTVDKHEPLSDGKFTLKNDYIGLDMGIKF